MATDSGGQGGPVWPWLVTIGMLGLAVGFGLARLLPRQPVDDPAAD